MRPFRTWREFCIGYVAADGDAHLLERNQPSIYCPVDIVQRFTDAVMRVDGHHNQRKIGGDVWEAHSMDVAIDSKPLDPTK